MVVKFKTAFLLIICMLVSLPALRAQMNVQASIEPETLLMGNVAALKVTVDVPGEKEKVRFPLLETLKGNRFVPIAEDKVELLPEYTVDTLVDGVGRKIRYNLSVQAFDSGKYVIPKFELLVGSDTLRSNALTLNVIPVKVKADDKLDAFSDPMAPFEVKFKDNADETGDKIKNHLRDFWWIYLLGIALACICFYLYQRYKETGSILPVKHITPYESAMKRLANLKKKALWQNGKTKEYYSRLVDILRFYLRDQFGINAMEMTSRQILKAIYANTDLKNHAEDLKPVLDTADFVKFAKENPLADVNEDVFRRVSSFIEETHPVEEPENKGKEARNDA